MLVPHKGGMDPGAAGMVYAEVVELWVASKQIAPLLIYHQFLSEFFAFQDVQVKADWSLPSPEKR